MGVNGVPATSELVERDAGRGRGVGMNLDACFSSGDDQPARKGKTTSEITVIRIRSEVLVRLVVLSNTVKPNATPAPVMAASPAVTTEWPLGRAIVTAYPS